MNRKDAILNLRQVLVKRRDALRDEASNAREGEIARVRHRARRVAPPRRGRIHLVVHRHSGRLYYKRVEPRAYRLLEAIGAGRALPRAIAAAGRVPPGRLEEWFATWMKLGFFCHATPRAQRPLRPRKIPLHDTLSRKI